MMRSFQAESRMPSIATTSVVLATAIAVAICLLLIVPRKPVEPESLVRVRNATKMDLHSVVLGSNLYGDVAAGQITSYQGLRQAYKYASLELEVNGVLVRRIADDYIGERPLGAGHFTYVIDFAGEPSITSLSTTIDVDSRRNSD